MPQILKHASAPRIIELRLNQPLPHSHVILQRPRVDRLARDGELRTAWRPDRDLVVIRFIEDVRVCRQRARPPGAAVEQGRRCIAHDGSPRVARDVGIVAATLGAAWVPVAAEVDVPAFRDGVQAEELHRVHVVVEGSVHVPGSEKAVAVGVEEGDYGGDGVRVVIDYVGEVGHGFFAFVHRGCELRCGEVGGNGACAGVREGRDRGIDDVDCSLPVGEVLRNPGHVICDQCRYDHDFVADC